MSLTRRPPLEIILPGLPPHRLLHVPGGSYRMGSPEGDKDADKREKPDHPVEIADFYLAEFHLTQDFWEALISENPSKFKGPRRPVENITWDQIHEQFLPALRDKTGQDYRLPTEAEWEYAARGGPLWENEPYRYAGSDRFAQVGWYAENSGQETHDVGLLLPNALGLYDMSGNVWEWCADEWHDNYLGAPGDGRAWINGEKNTAVLRGGSWNYDVNGGRVARRDWDIRDNWLLNLGFRLARGG